MTHKEKYNDTVTVDVIIPAYRPRQRIWRTAAQAGRTGIPSPQDSGYEYGRAVLEQRMGEMSDP